MAPDVIPHSVHRPRHALPSGLKPMKQSAVRYGVKAQGRERDATSIGIGSGFGKEIIQHAGRSRTKIPSCKGLLSYGM